MTGTSSAGSDWAPPGRDCGACGRRTCGEFLDDVRKGNTQPEGCPFYVPVVEKVGFEEIPDAEYSGIDIVGQAYDFWLAPLPGEVSARKIVLPFRSDLVEKWDIVPGDIVTGRPSGAGCPIQHVIRVIDANPITGVITGHVVGPAYSRDRDVKDVMEYHMLGFEGRAMVIGETPRFGKRYSFLPGTCMMGRAHTGLVNTAIQRTWGLQVRLEDVIILRGVDMGVLEEIDDKIDSGTAKVYTASEFKQMLGGSEEQMDADVVTCGTFGVMSGTMAVLSVPVADPGVFKKADTIELNGVPGTVGPCPNESLGLVDCVVYGTSCRDARYGGGHFFRDLVRGDEVEVVVTSGGKEYRRSVTIDDLPVARIILTRGAFKNYTAFVNPSGGSVSTIFSGSGGLDGNLEASSVSGCGEINPVQNDPGLRFLKPGYPIMINGARGVIIGTGTRSTPEKPNLSASADMKDMDPFMMGGFITSEGAECITSVAVAFPVADERSRRDLSVRDHDISLPVADVRDRVPRDNDDYGSVWGDGASDVVFDVARCLHCEDCVADSACPVEANPSGGLDGNGICMSCGLCVSTCRGKAFSCRLGSIGFLGTDVPIKLRQSSRAKGELLCERLKEEIEDGKWRMGGN